MTDAKPPRPPRRRARRAAWGLLALAGVLAVAHGAAWTWATGALAVGMSDWVTQRRAEGWSIDHGPPRRGGWPFAARLAMDDVRIETPAGLVHDAARIALQVAPARPDRLQVLLEGPQRIAFGAGALPFAAGWLAVLVPLTGGPAPVELDLAGLEAQLPEGTLRLRAARLLLHPPGAATAEPALPVALRAEGLAPPPSALSGALGPEVDSLSADLMVRGLRPLRAPPAAMAAAWRDGGGAVDIAALALRWGPVLGDAQGSVALDPALQPRARGTLRLAGAPAAVDALARAGLVEGTAARSVQAVLALMSRTPPEGGPPRVELPVALSGGVVSVARVPLLRVPPLDWSWSRGG